MSDEHKPKNVVLMLEGAEKRASLERGVAVHKAYPTQDYAIKSYQIDFAMNGGYVVRVAYEGTDTIDYLAFHSKDALLDALKLLLK